MRRHLFQWYWNDHNGGKFEQGHLTATDLAAAYARVKYELGDGDVTVVKLHVVEEPVA